MPSSSAAVEEAHARAAAAEEAKIELSLRLAELADARDNVSEFMVNGYHHQPVSQGLIEQLQRRCEEAELAAAVNARRAAAAEAAVESLRSGGVNGINGCVSCGGIVRVLMSRSQERATGAAGQWRCGGAPGGGWTGKRAGFSQWFARVRCQSSSQPLIDNS